MTGSNRIPAICSPEDFAHGNRSGLSRRKLAGPGDARFWICAGTKAVELEKADGFFTGWIAPIVPACGAHNFRHLGIEPCDTGISAPRTAKKCARVIGGSGD